jgi:ribosomal protein S18 acetylase RimI-like enzyme
MYTSAGFEAVGIRKNYYRSPAEDAVVMTADISPDDRCEK